MGAVDDSRVDIKFDLADSPEEQKLEWTGKFTHPITGEEETVNIKIDGFKDPNVIPAAVIKFTTGLLEIMAAGGPEVAARQKAQRREKGDSLDRELAALLGTDN